MSSEQPFEEHVNFGEFKAFFEDEAYKRRLVKINQPADPVSDGARYCNESGTILIDCRYAGESSKQIAVTVARGRTLYSVVNTINLPGSRRTQYSWEPDGWLSPTGLKLDAQRLAAKVIDEAL